jgi:hypothetical protein
MVFWCRLREPDIAGISGELTAFEPANDRIAVANPWGRIPVNAPRKV